MKLRELVRTTGFEVYLRQADPSSYLNVLKDIKTKEIFNIIIDIQPENMVNLLNVVSVRRFFCDINLLVRGSAIEIVRFVLDSEHMTTKCDAHSSILFVSIYIYVLLSHCMAVI